jgi:putative MATE family efflux protein
VFAATFLVSIGAAPEIVEVGQAYFRVAVLTLPLAVVSTVASATLRALGRARAPMLTTMFAVILNTTLGYGLVFGVGPLPTLGVVGAAWATFAAQATKAAVLLWHLYGRRSLARWELPPTVAEWWRTSRTLLQLTLPLTAKEIFWSVGTFLYTLLFERIGTHALAASQIANTLEAVFVVASIGLMVAATTLLGQAIGSGDGDLAQARMRALLRVGTATGLTFGALYLGTALLLPFFYPNVEADVLHIAFWGIVIGGIYHVVKVRNMILAGGVLPSVGDARAVVAGDIGGTLISLPLAYLLGFPLAFGVWGIFTARALEEAIKAIFFAWRAGRLRWDDLAARLTIPNDERQRPQAPSSFVVVSPAAEGSSDPG